jgi:predicted kinase
MLAGTRGTGKSCTADRNSKHFEVVHIEKVQAIAAEIAHGRELGNEKYGWEIWTKEIEPKVAGALDSALDREYPDLAATNRPLLIEGSFLITTWFADHVLNALSRRSMPHARHCVCLLLDFPLELIAGQIKKRNRVTESEWIRDLEKTRIEAEGYLRFACRHWKRMTSHEQLQSELDRLVVEGLPTEGTICATA